MQNFIDSMECVREKLGYTQSRMAKELGLSMSGYKKIISGITGKIDLYLVYQLHLMSGKCIHDLCGIGGDCLDIVRKMPVLSDSQKRFVRSILEFEAAFATENEDDIEDYISLMIPMGNLEDGMIWDSINIEMINVASYRKRFGAELDCALKITSEHMSPVYHRGDVLLISRQPPRDGDIGIFVDRETCRGYVRKYYQTAPVRLEPINGYGRTITIDNSDPKEADRWIRYGKVLTKMR